MEKSILPRKVAQRSLFVVVVFIKAYTLIYSLHKCSFKAVHLKLSFGDSLNRFVSESLNFIDIASITIKIVSMHFFK